MPIMCDVQQVDMRSVHFQAHQVHMRLIVLCGDHVARHVRKSMVTTSHIRPLTPTWVGTKYV
jgi:hypothetical protein